MKYSDYSKKAIMRQILWNFFKPVIIGWGSFAVIVYVLLKCF